MAEVCARHPGKLHGLATVDAYSGDAGARELTRAVKELRLRGVFVESARGDLLLGDKETRPMLKAAADLGVPVFVHPQTDPQLHKRFSRTGRIGLRLARGTINNAALINMLESGAFDEAPKLQLVVTTLALGGLMLAGGFGDGARIRSDAPALTRRHVYVDTMGINPVTVRAAIDLLGADHVLMGTDWPIVEEKSVPERLAKALAHSGLNAAEQQMVAGGNALRLLGAS
jgi:aminocarboxymuconate-semialdehyde decarboxylase